MVLVQYCLGYFLFPVVTAALLDHFKQHMPLSLSPTFLPLCHVFLKVELGPLHSHLKAARIPIGQTSVSKTEK
jgi:hypothetical protein